MIKSKIAPHITDIVKRLQEAGFETYIVGGAVRDFLIGRTPKDYDIATSAEPQEVRELFGRRNALIIGRRFRLVQIFREGEIVEVSTFRKVPPKDAQIPKKGKEHLENMIFQDNEFGSSEEDAWRRDFTVNAIFYDPVGDKIADFTGSGVSDLNAGIVRAIGEPAIRFEEDPVRILRALKLAGQYGFSFDEKTEEALIKNVDLITHASPSRLSLELEKILKNAYSDKILEVFHRYKFLRHFLPFIEHEWDSKEGIYMRELLAEKNRRVINGQYRMSVSLTMAAMTLPFAEREFGTGIRGELWDNSFSIDWEMRDLIMKVFFPRTFTKRMTASSLRNLLLLPRLFSCQKPDKVIHFFGYSHARELTMIQNELVWKNPQLPILWPSRLEKREEFRGPFGAGDRRNHKKRYGRGKYHGNKRGAHSGKPSSPPSE